MKGMGITATEASKKLGCSVATVTRWASRLQLGEKYGSCFVLKPEEIRRIKQAWNGASKGRPSKELSENSR